MKRLLTAAAVALAMAVPAAADTGAWTVTGSGVGTGAVAGDRLEIGVHSDGAGGDLTGDVESQFTLISSQFNDGGDAVCLSVADHRAVLLYRLRTPVTVPELPGEVFPYGAAYIEDNGDPIAGRPVDRMAGFAVREINVHFFCNVDPSTFFAAAIAEPIGSGNFLVQEG
jgi:hypothetical protein